MSYEQANQQEKRQDCTVEENIVTLKTEQLSKQYKYDESVIGKSLVDEEEFAYSKEGNAETSSVTQNETKRPECILTAPASTVDEWENLVASRTEHLLNQYEQDVSPHQVKQVVYLGADGECDTKPITSVATRKISLTEQYEIDVTAPTPKQPDVTNESNVVASRTENLLNQYKHDMSMHTEKRHVGLKEIIASEDSETCDANTITTDIIATRKESLLHQYDRDIACSKMEKEDIRAESAQLVSIGTHMNRYIALTKGEPVEHSDEDDQPDNSALYDEHGEKIERSGGKIEIVKSSDSISSIRNKFGGSTEWKKTETETPSNEVDPTKVKSALNVFKEKEVKIQETSSTFNRPTSRKVSDPKELMEIRKKATYGNVEELPKDGVVTKSVVIEKEELDTTIKHQALNVYKNLEKKEGNHLPLHKPKTKLISDAEAQATMEGIRTLSSSVSEASDLNETTDDLTVDTVSGYGSAAPCSPCSTLSEDYLSDHKEESPGDELKDSTDIEVKAKLSLDDVSIVKCQAEISSGDVASENDIEYVGVYN